jgi:hypothetical protein
MHVRNKFILFSVVAKMFNLSEGIVAKSYTYTRKGFFLQYTYMKKSLKVIFENHPQI